MKSCYIKIIVKLSAEYVEDQRVRHVVFDISDPIEILKKLVSNYSLKEKQTFSLAGLSILLDLKIWLEL